MNQHNNPDRKPDETPQQPASEAAPYPPPPPIFSNEPAPEFDPNAAPPPPPPGESAAGTTAGAGATAGAGGFYSASSGDINNPTKDERNWAMFAHLSALVVGFLISWSHTPILAAIGPLIIYLIKKDDSPFVADQAREALNFSITVGAILTIIMWLALALIWTFIVPLLFYPIAGIISLGALVFMIIAAVKAAEGQLYRYPFTLRLIN